LGTGLHDARDYAAHARTVQYSPSLIRGHQRG
jgi:hypothetical protein